MGHPFFDRPILNSPYAYPSRHWELDDTGQPTQKIIETRRRAEFITPIPKPKKQKGAPSHPETARLLQHWRHHNFSGIRPFFCQIEAVETAIWLTEVAPQIGKAGKRFLDHLANANHDANPELMRLALKLATGAGKTTVMAMLIAWQTINAVRRPGSKRFTRGFLIVAPGSPSRTACASSSPTTRTATTQPRAGAQRHARRPQPRQDRHHQLPRLQAARAHGAVQGRAPAAARAAAASAPEHAGNRRPDAPARHARSDGHEEHPRHQRRGPPLLPRESRHTRRRGAEGRRQEGGREEQRSRPPLDLRPGSRQPQARRLPRVSTSPPRPSSCAARAMPKARSSPGP
jgi:hypothetical protein